MIVRDLFSGVDEAPVIARTIFEDGRKSADEDNWIPKYYAQLTKLKNKKSGHTIYYGIDYLKEKSP